MPSVPPSHFRLFALLFLTISLLLIPASNTTAEGPEPLPSTLEQVLTIFLPPRDVADLARRLDGVAAIPDHPTEPVQLWQVGDRTTFWADNLAEDTQFELEAELLYVTDAAYIWAETGAFGC